MSHAFVDQMLEKSKAGELRSPVSETLEMHLVDFGRGEAVYEMEAREALGNPLGVIQGGVATALADAAMAAATSSILDDDEIQKSAITTIDIFARFIRPVNAKKVERLRAEAKVVRAGGRLVWAEADVLADDEVVGKFASTGIRVSFDPAAYIADRDTPMSEPGTEVMAQFIGAENVDRSRDYLEQLDPELHRYIMDFVYGEVYAGDALDPKTRALCTVAMLATLGQQLQLGVYVRAARRQGASEEEIREVLRQVAVYAGFPNAWNALATMKAALEHYADPETKEEATS